MVVKTTVKIMSIFLLSFSLFACNEDTPKLTKQKPTPTFELEKLDGGSIRFPSDTKGQIVVISFWADWCAYCKTELKNIEPLYQKYRSKGLTILAINIRQDIETARKFLDDINPTYDVLLDKDGKVTSDYGVRDLPATIIVDRNGNLYTRILGEFTPEAFELIIKELL